MMFLYFKNIFTITCSAVTFSKLFIACVYSSAMEIHTVPFICQVCDSTAIVNAMPFHLLVISPFLFLEHLCEILTL